MPIWLRKYTFKEISEFYDEEKKEYEKSQGKGKTTVVDSSGKVNTSNLPQFKGASQKSTSYK